MKWGKITYSRRVSNSEILQIW